jgi:hypothetical protein
MLLAGCWSRKQLRAHRQAPRKLLVGVLGGYVKCVGPKELAAPTCQAIWVQSEAAGDPCHFVIVLSSSSTTTTTSRPWL